MRDVAVVGLQFSGKSTVFEAVARAHAEGRKAHVAVVSVPDPRVEELARLHGSSRAVHAQLRLTDVPGLSLSDARGADALAVVLRAFGDDADPMDELGRFRAELAVADLATVEKALERMRKQARAGVAEAKAELGTYERAEAVLGEDRWLREERWEPDDARRLALLTPLTLKPLLHVVNLDETGDAPDVAEPAMAIRGLLEAEAAELDHADAAALLEEFGVRESATARFVRSVYALLDLVTFFSVAGEETHAWAVPRGTKAPRAAGTVHTDFERGFIRCEVESYEDLVAAGSWEAARERGMMRVEGRDYAVREGDVLHVRHSG